MDNNEWIRKLLLKAGDELKVARKEMESLDPVSDVVCFLCQRACVMLLIAWLGLKYAEWPRLNELKWLLDLCKEKDPDFIAIQSVQVLTPYSLEINNLNGPNFPTSPTREEAQRALEIAEFVRRFVLKKIYAVP